jgi:hypothetical protein
MKYKKCRGEDRERHNEREMVHYFSLIKIVGVQALVKQKTKSI